MDLHGSSPSVELFLRPGSARQHSEHPSRREVSRVTPRASVCSQNDMLDFDRSSVRSENRGPGEDQLRSTPKVRENLDRPKVEVSLWSACEGAMRTQVSGIYKI